MSETRTETELRSSDAHRAALDHLVEVVPEDRAITVSIDGLPAFDVRNKAARKRLGEALEWVIEIEITQMSLDAADAGHTRLIEEFDAEFREKHGIPR